MRIIDIREKSFPLRANMRNAAFDFSDLTTSVVAVVTDQVREGEPVVGYAWGSIGRHACGGAMRGRFIPRILAADPEKLLDNEGLIDPEKLHAVMTVREKPGGHAERSIPIGIIDAALWDAVGKVAGKPVWRLLAERYNEGKLPGKLPCYVGGGWYLPGNRISDLEDEMRRHQDAGYRFIKIKAGGLPIPDDVRRVEAALKITGSPDLLSVDSNGALSRQRALDYAKALAPYRLRWFEEPVDPLDLEAYASLAALYDPPLAQGENLYSLQEVRNHLLFGGFRPGKDFLQVDPPQAYGITMFARLVKMIEEMGCDRSCLWPHGGNLMSAAVVGGFGTGGCEGYPGGFGDFSGFSDDMPVVDGHVTLSQRPGLGWEGMPRLYPLMHSLVESLRRGTASSICGRRGGMG
jgi:L-alanine-DL-glutamate epimerase-like enolase superfamily enzyme